VLKQDQVRIFRLVGDLETFRRAQHVRHLVRVVLVHLAAEGPNEELFRHASRPAAQPRELIGCQQPHAKNLAVAIQLVGGPGSLARDAHRHDDQVLLVSDGRAGGELHRFVVHGHGHLFDVPDVASPGVLRDGARPCLSEDRYGPKSTGRSAKHAARHRAMIAR